MIAAQFVSSDSGLWTDLYVAAGVVVVAAVCSLVRVTARYRKQGAQR